MIIRRIGVLSAAKMGGILGVAIGLFAGVMMFFIGSMGGMAGMAKAQSGAGWMAGMGLMAIIAMPIMYGVFMFIAAAIQAVIYNFAARFVGGVQIETE